MSKPTLQNAANLEKHVKEVFSAKTDLQSKKIFAEAQTLILLFSILTIPIYSDNLYT